MNRRASSMFMWLASLALCLFVAGAPPAAAQVGRDDDPPLPVDPTPLAQLLTAQEMAQLAEGHKPKKQVELYLAISDAHLLSAQAAIKAEDYRTAERELDIYNKALAEAAKVAFSQQDGRRSMAKKIEQLLYKQIKTLELIERLFPIERVAFAEAALRRSKQLRIQALHESFGTEDVLKDPTKEKKADTPPAADKSSANDRAPGTGYFLSSGRSFTPRRKPAPQLPGDYLNEEEDDHVRSAQQADDRVKVFMKIADRRLTAITGPPVIAAADKKAQKKAEEEEREWGPLPKGDRAQMLRHYARAIEEVMAKLEDAYERNPKSSALPRALATLRDSTDRHLQILRSLQAEMKSDRETDALKEAINEAEVANLGARSGLTPKQ